MKLTDCLRKPSLMEHVAVTICNKSCIGEPGRSISIRMKENLFKKSFSAVEIHFQEEHHTTDCYNNVQRKILHSGLKYMYTYICKESLSMNGCQGRLTSCQMYIFISAHVFHLLFYFDVSPLRRVAETFRGGERS